MATTLFSSISSPSITTKNRDLGLLYKSSFLLGPLPFPSSCFSHHGNPTFSRRCFKSLCARSSSSNNVPKQFRQENLKEGVMDNFKNVPEFLRGFSPPQLNMFTSEHSAARQMPGKITEESISSASSYLSGSAVTGMLSSMTSSNSGTSANYAYADEVEVEDGRGGRIIRKRERVKPPAPDLPSFLLDNRIIYIGMPLVPQVTELIIAEFMWCHYYRQDEPIHVYINCSGTQNDDRQIIGFETDAYAIADSMALCGSDVYTVNIGMAHGQAAMLLSLGKKGYRAIQPHASTKLYLPEVYRSSGDTSDMWIKGKELEANTNAYLDLLSVGTGKSVEELANDLQAPLYLPGLKAIEYGVVDRIIETKDSNPEVIERRRKEQEKLEKRGPLPGYRQAFRKH